MRICTLHVRCKRLSLRWIQPVAIICWTWRTRMETKDIYVLISDIPISHLSCIDTKGFKSTSNIFKLSLYFSYLAVHVNVFGSNDILFSAFYGHVSAESIGSNHLEKTSLSCSQRDENSTQSWYLILERDAPKCVTLWNKDRRKTELTAFKQCIQEVLY